MKQDEALQALRQDLGPLYGAEESRIMAAMVMEHVTGLEPNRQPAHGERLLTEAEESLLQSCRLRLLRHEPVQYVIHRAWFYDMPLFVDTGVLIPRPETEELVQWVVEDVKARGLDVFHRGHTQSDKTDTLKILDVGTGSGCIALSLKKQMPAAEVWGCDVSEAALNIARRNGSELDIRVDFQGIDFLDAAQHPLLPTVDIIVSNPPYIPRAEAQTMAPHVVQFEPHEALFVPDENALVFYAALASFGARRLSEGGRIYAEIHESLGAPVQALFHEAGYTAVELRRDMQGKERMIRVQR